MSRDVAGTISVLSAHELKACSCRLGLPSVDQGFWKKIVESTNRRIEERVRFGDSEAVRFGAFSYLLEVVCLWPNGGEPARACAVAVSEDFLKRNALLESDSLSEETLHHFAQIIQSNNYDWEGLLIAFLDPEAARLDRLRENLKLTPAERYMRQQKLISQIKKARRV
jgi:hypothetical protein